ncbi:MULTISPECIES: hypothetical protein [unclassified Pseudomonas]|uniref:hypothetical protein n=1 Tax=unclassified Pseudomonas TaxID=196821 RepID=UPI000702BB14|nr:MULTISPECIES: hypothetical protein [unclassified Pseudomonas]KQZ94523.1 hypothetical protein ASD60_00550 [Pseudomonas sp. Root562]
MNIKSLFIVASVFLMSGPTYAGTLTIKAPPEGLELITPFGRLKHGDPDRVESVAHANITPVEGSENILGFINTYHDTRPDAVYGNRITCELKGDYALEIDIVGFEKVLCRNKSIAAFQRREQGADDVVLTFTKTPKSD